MKTIFKYFPMIMLLVVTACTGDEEFAVSQGGIGGEVRICRMVLDGSVAGFSDATRAGDEYEWKDGDRLYIRFSNNNDTILGYANYMAADKEWQISCSGTLPSNTSRSCEVYFFENATYKSNTSVELTAHSAVYEDNNANYYYSGGVVALRANLLPKTGRVRFVSAEKSEFSLAGIRYYVGFDLETKTFCENYKRRLILNADVEQGTGEYTTEFVYGFYEREYYLGSEPVKNRLDIINHKDTANVYNKTFPLHMLNAGKSGHISIPSESLNKGWQVGKFNGGRYFAKTEYHGPTDAHGSVYMGNGLLWYSGVHDYIAWGALETGTDDYYTGTGNISATSRDYLYNWNKEERIATKAEIEKMLSTNNCFNNFIVSDDFNVLTQAEEMGYANADFDIFNEENYYYWTSNAVSSSNAYAVVFSKDNYEFKSMSKSYLMNYFCVREVDEEAVEDNGNTSAPSGTTINGFEYVDLGLPSGVKWAAYNVGAGAPHEYGNYYAWGETTTKSSYTEDNSTTYGKLMSDIGGNATYDVARKQWGSSWRLPTKAEFKELLDEDNCTWEWTTQSGVNGYKVTSKVNGNSIFLPAAGYRGGSSLHGTGSYGSYWSSTPDGSSTSNAYYLGFTSGAHDTYWYYRRSYGLTVRPVSE